MLPAVLSPSASLGLAAFGFAVAVVGHLAGDRRVAAVGVAVLFVATGLLLISAWGDYSSA